MFFLFSKIYFFSTNKYRKRFILKYLNIFALFLLIGLFYIIFFYYFRIWFRHTFYARKQSEITWFEIWTEGQMLQHTDISFLQIQWGLCRGRTSASIFLYTFGPEDLRRPECSEWSDGMNVYTDGGEIFWKESQNEYICCIWNCIFLWMTVSL